MQLAALHLATSSVLPDELLDMTGEERAIILIRQSWGNRPLSKEECVALDNIKQLARGLSPTISLLCHDIELSSKQLYFLYLGIANHDHNSVDCFEGSAYLNLVDYKKVSSRCYLTPQEESRVIGTQARKPIYSPRLVKDQQVQKGSVDATKIKSLQQRLSALLNTKGSRKSLQLSRKSLRLSRKSLHLSSEHTFPLKDVEPTSSLNVTCWMS